jgi:hypothetical protein
MSEKRARYDGPSGTGVDVPVELDNGEVRNVHVDQGSQLPTELDGQPIKASVRDALLLQEDWSEVRQATGSDIKSKGGDSR